MSTVINLVSGDSQLVQLVRETGVPCVVGLARRAHGAWPAAGAKQPAVLVLDLRDEPQIPPALPQLKRQHPATGVLLVASKLDPALMLEAMRAGVNEFVTAPVTVAELQAAIKRLMGNWPRLPRRGLRFIGAKGGVGATTVAVNIATALAKRAPDRRCSST